VTLIDSVEAFTGQPGGRGSAREGLELQKCNPTAPIQSNRPSAFALQKVIDGVNK
jgi:hypothetical protein